MENEKGDTGMIHGKIEVEQLAYGREIKAGNTGFYVRTGSLVMGDLLKADLPETWHMHFEPKGSRTLESEADSAVNVSRFALGIFEFLEWLKKGEAKKYNLKSPEFLQMESNARMINFIGSFFGFSAVLFPAEKAGSRKAMVSLENVLGDEKLMNRIEKMADRVKKQSGGVSD